MHTITIKFEPLIPAATDVWGVGERIFIGAFQKAMGGKTHKIYHERAQPNEGDFNDGAVGLEPFQKIVGQTFVTQRQAALATSLMRWLGSQIGDHFLDEVAQLQATLGPRYTTSECYVMAWARENHPDHQRRWHICKERLPTDSQRLQQISQDTCSINDADAIASTIAWLGSKNGTVLIASCRKRRLRALQLVRTRERAVENARMIGHGLKPTVPLLAPVPAVNAGQIRALKPAAT